MMREETRLLLMIGVLGGFTTFSAFGLDTFHLFNDGQPGRAAANIVANNVIALAAVWLAYRITGNLIGA